MNRKEQGKETVQRVFGGALYQQGRGYYTALELFAMLRGSVLLEQQQARLGDDGPIRVLPPVEQEALYLRPSHAFARRLMSGDHEASDHEKVKGEATERTLRALLRGLENPIPGTRKPPKTWSSRHFFPFPAELAHYDAVLRRKKLSIERYIFRGGGGLAHKILRSDPDAQRLARNRDGLRRLMSDSGSAVGRIAQAMAKLDLNDVTGQEARDVAELEGLAFRDAIEGKSWTLVEGKETRWFGLLREGVDRIMVREELTDFHRVDALMNLIPLCLSMHQLAMSWRMLGRDENGCVVLDAGHGPSAMRELARQNLTQATGAITNALLEGAKQFAHHDLLSGAAAWRTGPRSFFTTSLYAVGAVNASTGRRYFCVRPALLETIAAAFVDGQVPFRVFTEEVLFERLGFITDYASAHAAGDLDIDRADLDENARHLAARLSGLGLLQEFSDATRMVGLGT